MAIRKRHLSNDSRRGVAGRDRGARSLAIEGTRPAPRGVAIGMTILAVLVAWALALPAWGGVETETRTLRREFPAADAVRLANLAGAVELVPVAGKAGGRMVVVEATIHARGDDAAETRRLLDALAWKEGLDKKSRTTWALSYPVDDYSGFAYVRKGSGFWDDGRSTLDYMGERVRVYGGPRSGIPLLWADLRIEVPAGVDFAIRNGVGAVSGGKLDGTFGIDTASGDVEIDGCKGSLWVDTGSGDVDLGEVVGDLSADTGSGGVRVERLVGDGTIDTGSGDVEVRFVQSARLGIDTGSGHVRVSGGSADLLDVDTGSGDIRIEGTEVVEFRGDTGSGDVILRSSLDRTREVLVDTGSGSVRILASHAASFDIEADQGSGDLVVGYDDAVYKRRGREIYGARRGDAKTRIRVETGSGDCVIQPAG